MTEQLKTPYTSATGDRFLFDTKENQAFVKRFAEWHKKGYVTTEAIYGSYTSGLFTNLKKNEARSYMCIGSSAGASYQRPTKDANGKYPFDVGITTIPQADASNKKVISQGPSLCIFGKSDSQEVLASWLFVKFLTTNVDFQAEFSMVSGYMPVIKSVNEHEIYKTQFLNKADGGDNITALAAKVGLEQEKAYFVSDVTEGEKKHEKTCAISVYVANRGDDLWTTAKRLSLSPEGLMESNPALTFPLKEEERMIIYRQKRENLEK
jgi:multiple sugar transport system substrate-binding protein